MKITGIIAEYNPFHNGHAKQIDIIRQNGGTHIVAVMSGSFVQRGDIACFSKWQRARAALLNGVDLVAELPVQYSLSSAKPFATAGVYLLNALGADEISFGSESGNTDELTELAEACQKAESSNLMRTFIMEQKLSYPQALEKAVEILYSKEKSVKIKLPNNLLGIEYINAINKINPNIKPFAICRYLASHDSDTPTENIASASYLRSLVKSGSISDLERYVPKSAFEIYKNEYDNGSAPDYRVLDRILLHNLQKMTAEELKALPDMSEGLENRFHREISAVTDTTELVRRIATKRYTNARIRRAAFAASLGITSENRNETPSFIRVLGANKRGFEILSRLRENELAPYTKFADLYETHPNDIDLTVRATDLYSLSLVNPKPQNLDFTENTVILK